MKKGLEVHSYVTMPVRRFATIGLCLWLVLATFAITPQAQASEAAAPAAVEAFQEGPLPGSFAPGPCPIDPIEGITLDCGTLTVAESRQANSSGRTLQLAVAIMRSPNLTSAPDPVLFLQGGPGGAAIVLAPFLAQTYAPVLAQRDIVIIDQRGTGFSQPNLDCDFSMLVGEGLIPLGGAASERPAVLQFFTEQLIICGELYRALGVDLSAFNSVENAADLEDLRVALGVPAWNIVGASYGSRLALTAMRYRPDTIRSVVLDAPYPLQANFHVDAFGSFNQALDRLFSDCANDPACNAAYPNLAETFDTMVQELNAVPAQLPLFDPETGETLFFIPVAGVDVATIVFSLLYDTSFIPLMPLFITQVANGDYELLTLLLNIFSGGTGLSLGTTLAVQCNEDVTFAQPVDFVAARDANRRASPLAFSILHNEAILEVCSAWGLTNPNPAENQPVVSDLPTLLIVGTYDPITPPQYARDVASTLSNSQIVEYPRGGHATSAASVCVGSIIAGFVNNPGAPADPSCIALEAPQPFLVP